MREIKSYRDLDVWQLGVELAVDCNALTNRFPADERFGLTGQTRKAAVSIPSNVAEGHNRRTPQSNNAYRNHVYSVGDPPASSTRSSRLPSGWVI